MLTASEYLKNRKNYSGKEVIELKRHAEDFLFFKYEIMRLWNREMAEQLHQIYCEVLYGEDKEDDTGRG